MSIFPRGQPRQMLARTTRTVAVLFTLAATAFLFAEDQTPEEAKAKAAREAEVEATSERFLEVKKRYYHAMLDGNIEEAKRSVYMRPEQMPLLTALLKRYSAEQRYCDAFEAGTGVQPEQSVSTRRKLRDGWKCEVEVDGDVAAEWKMPYRRVD